MTKSPITADVHEAFDVPLHLAPEIAFHAKLEFVDRIAQALLILFSHLFHAQIGTHVRVRAKAPRR